MRLEPPPQLPPLSARIFFGIGGVVIALVAGVVAVAGTGGTARATIAFRDDTGMACSFCHATPGTDMRILTIEGQRFRNNGFRIVGPAPPPAPPSRPPSGAAPSPAGAACGWYAIMLCSTSRGEAQRWNSANGAGRVVNTSSGEFPNFRGGFFCVVEGPQGKRQADMTAAFWRKNGSPTAYVKNAC